MKGILHQQMLLSPSCQTLWKTGAL